MKRHQVEIITESSKISKKRIYTESEYNKKLGIKPKTQASDVWPPPMKKAKIVLDDNIEDLLAAMEQNDTSSEDETVKKVSKKSVKKTQENDDWSDDQPFYGFKPCDVRIIFFL